MTLIMKKHHKSIAAIITLLVLCGFAEPLCAAESLTIDPVDMAPLIAKVFMGLGVSLGLAGSAIGLSIGFQALLGGGSENFFKLIPVALMPSSQGIYAIVVLFTNLEAMDADPFTAAGKGAVAGFAMLFSGWYQGMVCAAGIRSILEGRNTLANSLVAAAMPETYAVFALVMTFIMQ